jgi:hypothetical protein
METTMTEQKESGAVPVAATPDDPGWRFTCPEHGWGSNLIPCPDDRHKETEQGESSDEQ